jgi:hypothetical protein
MTISISQADYIQLIQASPNHTISSDEFDATSQDPEALGQGYW